MKSQDKKALFGKTTEELIALRVELERKIAQGKAQKIVGKLKNLRSISVQSDDVARINTVLRMKELEKGTTL